MSDHQHTMGDIWNMREGIFVRGCYQCLVPSSTLLKDIYYIPVSPAYRACMELVRSKGYQVDTDGSTALVIKDGGWYTMWAFITSDEREAIISQHGAL